MNGVALDATSIINITAGALNLVASIYIGYRNRRIRKADAELARMAALEAEWKRKTDYQLEELRGIMRRLEFPVRTKLGVDIRLDR